jgi:hypothetical protein
MVPRNKFRKNFKRVQIFFQNHLIFTLVKATKTDDGVVLKSVAHPIMKTAGNDCRNELSPQCGHSRKSADSVCTLDFGHLLRKEWKKQYKREFFTKN